MKYYIILFTDGAYMLWSHEPDKKMFVKGTRFFETTDNSIQTIIDWVSCFYHHDRIKEIL